MINSSNYLQTLNEIDYIYSKKPNNRCELLSFLKEKIYDSPMIYWDINPKNEIIYDSSLGINKEFIELYNTCYKKFDNLPPQKVGTENLAKKNIIFELDFISKKNYEKSVYYTDFLKYQNAYNILQIHLTHNNKCFGIINFLRTESQLIDLLNISFLAKIISIHEFYNNKNPVLQDYELTKREFDVFQLLKQGYSYIDISKKLFISLNTTKTHTKNIFSKLDVSSRHELQLK